MAKSLDLVRVHGRSEWCDCARYAMGTFVAVTPVNLRTLTNKVDQIRTLIITVDRSISSLKAGARFLGGLVFSLLRWDNRIQSIRRLSHRPWTDGLWVCR